MKKMSNVNFVLLCIAVFILGMLALCFGLWFYTWLSTRNNFTNEEFKSLNNINRIEIHVEHNHEAPGVPRSVLKTVNDPAQVQLIVEKVQTYADGWQQSGFNYYVGRGDPVYVYFFRKNEVNAVFVFSIGHNNKKPYITTFDYGKYLTADEFTTLMETLGINKGLVMDFDYQTRSYHP